MKEERPIYTYTEMRKKQEEAFNTGALLTAFFACVAILLVALIWII